MRRKIKTKKVKQTKTRKTKTTKVKVQKPVKVKELFKYKKVNKSVKVEMGNHYYNETLATDDNGDPIVTQSVCMSGNKVLRTIIFDVKNNVIINETNE